MDQRLLEIIDVAIRREEEAYEFYTDLKKKVEDSSTQDMLDFVAKEELKHKAFLVDFKKEPHLGDLRLSDVTLYRIAEHQKEPEVSSNMSMADLFLLAAHREARSNRFYLELARVQTQPELRDLLERMANEELKHREKMEYLYSNAAFPQTDGG